MAELNANLVVLAFAVTGALGGYWGARKTGVPIVPALKAAAVRFAWLGLVSLFYLLALNALHLRWNSLAGYGLGLAFGFAGLLVLLSSKSLRHRRGSLP